MTTIKANIVNKNNEERILLTESALDFMFLVQLISNTNFDKLIGKCQLFGELRYLDYIDEEYRSETWLNNASHMINSIKIDISKKVLEIDIRMLDTPKGNLLYGHDEVVLGFIKSTGIQFLPRIINNKLYTFDFYQKVDIKILEKELMLLRFENSKLKEDIEILKKIMK